MLLSKTVVLKWNSKIKKHYIDLGYTYTKMKDKFEVSVNDLTNGSNVEVDIQCDYCGNKYKKHWANYLIENLHSNIHKDCCGECRKYKTQESNESKYGTNSVFKLYSIKDKIAKTNLEKYGVQNPFSSPEIKNKIIETNIRKYGVPNPTQNKDVMKKVSNTCMMKYGVKYFIQTQHHCGEDSPVWKGGIARQRNERYTYDYISWRKKVFIRDLHTCQCCGKRNGNGKTVKLNAHHIYNWKDYEDIRFNEDNGITLCEDCHNLFHSKFGKRNNTKIQLDKFLNENGKKIC